MAEDFSKLCNAGFFEVTAGDIGSPLEQIDHFSFLVGQLVHEFLLRWRNVSFQASLGRKGQRNHNTNNKKPFTGRANRRRFNERLGQSRHSLLSAG